MRLAYLGNSSNPTRANGAPHNPIIGRLQRNLRGDGRQPSSLFSTSVFGKHRANCAVHLVGELPKRFQNLTRTTASTDRGPPVCSMGARPLPGLPVPNIRFSIDVDWPKYGLFR